MAQHSRSALTALQAALILTITMLKPIPVQAGAPQTSWQADPAIIEKTQAERPGFVFVEDGVPAYTLPPLLPSGETGDAPTATNWESQRESVLDLFREHVYGHTPQGSVDVSFIVLEEDPAAMNGKATLQRVAIRCTHEDRELTFECTLFLPNHTSGPVPTYLFINNRRPTNTDPSREVKSGFWPAEDAIARGYGIAAIHVRQLSPDSAEHFLDGAIHLFEGARYQNDPAKRPPNAWGSLAAWAWGASRTLDYLQTLQRIDATKVAVAGHSRAGKAALWAASEDERFALAISNGSGCGGAALSRRRFGETVERINLQFPHWFCQNFSKYDGREDELPLDQHMLHALIAPRAVYVSSADDDLWADPRGEFLALAHASPVFELYGYAGISPEAMPPLNQPIYGDRQAYHIRDGNHNLTPRDWQAFFDWTDILWFSGKNTTD